MTSPLQRKRGSREWRVHAAPAVSCAKMRKKAHTSIQVQRRQSAIPCAMVLRLMPCSPRRRIRLVTVVNGLMHAGTRLGRPASADLAPATGVRTTRFCRTRTRASPGGFAGSGTLPAISWRRRKQCRSSCAPLLAHGNRPANKPARRHCRVHHIPSRVRDDRDPPLLGDEMTRSGELICPAKPAKCFFHGDWTTQITLKSLRKLKFTRSGFFGRRKQDGWMVGRHDGSK